MLDYFYLAKEKSFDNNLKPDFSLDGDILINKKASHIYWFSNYEF